MENQIPESIWIITDEESSDDLGARESTKDIGGVFKGVTEPSFRKVFFFLGGGTYVGRKSLSLKADVKSHSDSIK